MVYIEELDWRNAIGSEAIEPLAKEHIIALAKLKCLIVIGADGIDYLPSEDDQGAWSMQEYYRNDEE